MTENRKLRMYTIYRSPRDYPGMFVLRGWSISPESGPQPDEEPIVVSPRYHDCVKAVPPECDTQIMREDDDDFTILETWV